MSLEENESLESTLSESTEQRREQWDRKIEYILSLVGYIVGLGNFWRFPYLCMRNGGGAFLVPFVVCLIFIAFPIFFLELSLGQFTARSVIHCWEACPLFKGVGSSMLTINCICSLYYVMIVTWTLYYLYNSFISPLPWTLCGNKWNTESCTKDENLSAKLKIDSLTNTSSIINNTQLNNASYPIDNTTRIGKISSQEEFWQNYALDMSSGITEMGSLNVEIFICLVLSWIIIYLCIIKGVKSVGKVVYVTATLPYILLAVLLVRGCTLPGSAEGILYYITPNFSRIMKPKVWIEAAIQVFYSTCVCWGPLINMASYNKFQNNCLRDAAILVTLGEGFSIIGGFVVFSALGFMAHSKSVHIEDVMKSGPGLIFVAYPEVVSKLPLPNLWAVLFFLMVLTIGLDSQFAGCEPLISALCDAYPWFRKRRIIFTGLIMAVYLFLGIPFCMQGGIYIFQLMDWYIAAFCIPLFGVIECIVFGWIYGAANFSRDVQLMIGRPIPMFIRILWCFVTPLLLLILLITIIINYEAPTYGEYSYPNVANIIGIVYALVPLLPLMICAFSEMSKASGNTLVEKLNNAMQPTILWQPGNRDGQKRYANIKTQCPKEWPEKIWWTLTGR